MVALRRKLQEEKTNMIDSKSPDVQEFNALKRLKRTKMRKSRLIIWFILLVSATSENVF